MKIFSAVAYILPLANDTGTRNWHWPPGLLWLKLAKEGRKTQNGSGVDKALHQKGSLQAQHLCLHS